MFPLINISSKKITNRVLLFNICLVMVIGVVLDLHAELYKETQAGENDNTCYFIVLTTNKGMIKLDMIGDYQRYRTWSMTINHMLMLSSSFTKYELQFYKN